MIKPKITFLYVKYNNRLNRFCPVFHFFIGVLLLSFIVGCSGMPPMPTTHKNQSLAISPDPNKLTNTRVKQKLTQQYQDWKDVRYKLGGNSKKGIDCSGFVHITFKQKMGLNIPRTTSLLAKTGMAINQQQLAPGDLVFFITGFTKRHVGIYMGNGDFLHASTSKGVMISSLYSPYWSTHYWKSIRILAK